MLKAMNANIHVRAQSYKILSVDNSLISRTFGADLRIYLFFVLLVPALMLTGYIPNRFYRPNAIAIPITPGHKKYLETLESTNVSII